MADHCKSCRFWKKDTRAPEAETPLEAIGSCRHHPPRVIDPVVAALMPPPRYSSSTEAWIDTLELNEATRFPATFGSDWCGEFDNDESWLPL